MTQENENKQRRVDDKRADVPLQWSEPATFPANPSPTTAVREVQEYTGLDTIACALANAADSNGCVLLSAQSCDLLYRAMTTPIVAPAVQAQAELTEDLIERMAAAACVDATRLSTVFDFARSIERHVRSAAREQKQAILTDDWLIDGGLIYRLNHQGFNRDEINVTMVNGSRDVALRHDAAVELLAELRRADRFAAREQARITELEAQLAECVALSHKWAAAAGDADGRAEQARNEALEEAALATIRFTAVPRDCLGPATSNMKAYAATGERIAAIIRGLKTEAPAASKEGESHE